MSQHLDMTPVARGQKTRQRLKLPSLADLRELDLAQNVSLMKYEKTQ